MHAPRARRRRPQSITGLHRVVAVRPTPDWSPRRLDVKPVDGPLLLRPTGPRFSRIAKVVKGCFDRFSVVLLLPLLLGAAVAVKLGGGPVFFRQIRVGRHGETFRMVKFR